MSFAPLISFFTTFLSGLPVDNTQISSCFCLYFLYSNFNFDELFMDKEDYPIFFPYYTQLLGLMPKTNKKTWKQIHGEKGKVVVIK